MIGRRLALGGAGALALAHRAQAQAWPTRPIRMIVPYAPGGGTDALGRIVAERLQERLGQQIVVHNQGGASGVTGSDAVRRSDPDGYTLLFNASLFVLGKSVVAATPYDPLADFRPVVQVGEVPLVLAINPGVAGNTLQELLATLRKDPKKYFFALSSAGSAGHLATLDFMRATGVSIDTITYRGTAAALNDVVGGSVHLFFDPLTVTLPQARAGRVRAVMVTSAERSSLAPEIPTAVESGLKDFVTGSWYGIWAPRAVPDAVVNRVASAMTEVAKDPQFLEKTRAVGIIPTLRGPAEAAAFTRAEAEKGIALLNAAGFKPE